MDVEIWYSLAALLVPAASLLVTGHAVLSKRDSASAVTWVALAWLVPVLGAVLYLLFGINRMHRRLTALGREQADWAHDIHVCDREDLLEQLGQRDGHLRSLYDAMERVTIRPLVGGNTVRYLVDGDEAYPAMLEAIRGARESVALATYILGNDVIGRTFADVLEAAVHRGVEVRVLIDNAGERYTWPSMVGVLRRRGVMVARFFPSMRKRFIGINLCNHRKLLVVDGRVGFTGGMNIRRHHCMNSGRRATRDLQFRFEGPVVRQLQEVFYEDWFFATRERLDGRIWFPDLSPVGGIIARGVRGGPDENLLKLHWALHAGIASANRSVRILTPYFLPDATLMSALIMASLRGVRVDVVVPAHSNLPFVSWAMMAQIPELVEHGVHVWLTPKPFDHGKLMVVDEAWTFLGSTNWDPRSLRLNF
ncbi:MAG: phospholipase D-like domain-containing protein, partial [Aquisalimonadaceae bacterium]